MFKLQMYLNVLKWQTSLVDMHMFYTSFYLTHVLTTICCHLVLIVYLLHYI